MVDYALEAADIVAERGISAEVIDLRTPAPYSPALESEWVPTVDDIVAAIDEVCADR
jgi:pyruvate/2-oxoglutarate/acetoin dehydrogenase E1 component